MARIRSIKPEFPEDEKLGTVCREARLLFILLWTFSDDLGRFRANSVLLKNKLFPYDEDLSCNTVNEWLKQLAVAKRVQLYEFDGQVYGRIVNWTKHQRIDNASKSTLPEPPIEEIEDSSQRLAANRREIPRDSASTTESAAILGGSPLDRRGKEGIGREASPRKSANKPICISDDFELVEVMREYAIAQGLSDPEREFQKFRDHHLAKGTRFKNWEAAWRTWVGRAIEYGANKPAARGSPDFQPAKKLRPELYQDP